MSYGILSTGYARKPLNVLLAELEEAMKQEFGSDVIQTAQSPFGQLNGLSAAFGSQFNELAEDIYQANDPDQAEGKNLDRLGRFRLLSRGLLSDAEFRMLLTNKGNARIDIGDIISAVRSITGVTYGYVWTNETGEVVDATLEAATIAVAVIGGEDEDIADAIRAYIVPGISTYGNYKVISETGEFCRSYNIIRPIDVPVTLEVFIRTTKDRQGCPTPTATTIRDAIVEKWPEYRLNGMNVTDYHIRQLVEGSFTGVEVFRIEASRDSEGPDSFANIGFIEIASLDEDDVTVTTIEG